MRTYFIDYCQIWIPPSEERWDKSELLHIQNNIDTTLFGGDTTIGKCMCLAGMKLHIYGRYFDSFDLSENMRQIFEAVKTIYVLHEKYWNFDEVKPTRLDFACNLPMFLNTHDFTMTSCADQKARKYYYGCEADQNLSGITIGTRGRHAVQLTVYDKRYSPSRHPDKRLDTFNYTRHEYKVGRNKLQRRLGIKLLKDLRKYETEYPKDLIDSLRKLKDVIFDDEDKYNDRQYTKSDFINSIGIEIEDTDREQTIEEIAL
ncbi:MAG TPA: hypothetical protein EYO89_01770 [Candidatus Dadabacteria bacterium]|nr:hypothetical protein [Candidatus Dadabacteria bacterium]